MNVDIQEQAPCRKKISVNLSGAEVTTAYEEAFQGLAANVQLPGYRRGHVPRKMLERKFSAQIQDEVRSKLISDSLSNAFQENKLTPLGDPKIDLGDAKPEKGQDFTFSAEVDVRPVFDLSEYKGLKLVEKTAPVEESDIDGRLSMLRERFAEEKPSTAPVAGGDVVYSEVAFMVDGEEIVKQENQALRIEGSAIFGIEVGDLAGQLGGLNHGDHKSVSFTVPEAYPRQDLRGKAGTFEITVKDIRNRVMPELDEAFAQRVGMESMEKLRDQLKQSIEMERKNAARGDLEQQLAEQLIAANSFDLPEGLIKSQAEHAFRSTLQRLGQMGASQEYLKEQEATLRASSVIDAEKSLRRTIIYQEIANKEEIEVTPQDIQEHLSRLAMYYGTTLENMFKEIQRRNGLPSIQAEIADMKITQLLIDAAEITHENAAPETESEA